MLFTIEKEEKKDAEVGHHGHSKGSVKSTIGRFQERGKQNLPRQRGDQRKSKKELVVNNMEKIIGKPGLFIHMGADWNQVEKITVGQTVKGRKQDKRREQEQRHKVSNINIFSYVPCVYISE